MLAPIRPSPIIPSFIFIAPYAALGTLRLAGVKTGTRHEEFL
jgi:hypothetical protein